MNHNTGISPNIGQKSEETIFLKGFTRLCLVSLSGATKVIITANGSELTLPTGMPMFFETPQHQPHGEVKVQTTGSFLFQEYR